MGSIGKVTGRLCLSLFMLALISCSQGAAPTARQEAVRLADTNLPQALKQRLLAELEQRGIDPNRRGSAPPESNDNAVLDLRMESVDPDGPGGNDPTGITIKWTHRLIGDYDQNGIVQINDITPLGQNFNQAVDYETWSTGGGEIKLPTADSSLNLRRAQVDGDGNGILNLSDLTPIAAHWQQRMDGYRVYRRGPRDSSYVQLPHNANPSLDWSISISEGKGGGAEALTFEYTDTPEVPGWYDYIIRAYDDESGKTGPVDRGFSRPEMPASAEADHMHYFGQQLSPVTPPVYGGGRILLVRNDNGNYSNGYQAIKADLDIIGADYDETGYIKGVGVEAISGGYESVIWYRGGFGGPYPEPQKVTWSADEMDDLRQVLAGGRNLLLMSQNHGSRDLFVGMEANAWGSLGYEIVDATIDPVDTMFTHMEGLPTDRGLGPGDGMGFLPVAACSLLGGFETDPLYDDGMGQDDGERYAGKGGRIPYAIRVPTGSQFCVRAWTNQIIPTEGLGGMGAADGFQPGLFIPSYEGSFSHVKGYVSYGCTKAPYGPMGVHPSYAVSAEGLARYWIIGYSWAEVQVLQDPENSGEPTHRFDMLCNVLDWLRE